MAEGKWLHGLRPGMPLAKAAREVLSARLEVVRDYLPKAVSKSNEDTEHVHQLRVGTRRADAAFRIFRSCMPGRVYRAGRERLRTIRRAAGAARDWDVFLLALKDRLGDAPVGEQAGLDWLIGYSLGQREAAQAALTVLEADPSQPFDKFLDETIEEVRPSHDHSDAEFVDLARPMLKTMLGKLREAAGGNLKDYEHLHQVRIVGKRLRYAMEVFADCFAPEFRSVVYPQVESMQDVLGRANDSHVATGRLVSLRERLKQYPATWERVKVGIEALLKFHQRRLPQERRRFEKWWQGWGGGDLAAILENDN